MQNRIEEMLALGRVYYNTFEAGSRFMLFAVFIVVYGHECDQ